MIKVTNNGIYSIILDGAFVKKKKETKKDFNCFDCQKDTKNDLDYYMVQKVLWKTYGVGKRLLCWKCLEKRMGRAMKAEDLTHCPQNMIFNKRAKNLINNKEGKLTK